MQTMIKQIKGHDKNIYGELYLPDACVSNLPLIIYCHGLADNYICGLDYAKALTKDGYAVYCFDFYGGSENSKSLGATIDMSIMTEVEDLQMVLNNVQDWSMIDDTKILLLGASQGAFVASIVASQKVKQIAGLILLYPAFNLGDMMKSRFQKKANIPDTFPLFWITSGKSYALDIWDYDIYQQLPLYTKPVLILHGNNDDLVPLSYSTKAQKIYPKCELYVIDGAKHEFINQDFEKALGYIKNYLKTLENKL